MIKPSHYPPSNGRTIVHLCEREFDQVEWGDDRASVLYNGLIHTFGVAVKAVTSGNVHIISDEAANIIGRIAFPSGMTARAGIKPSMILGYPVAFGGVGLAPTGNIDVWGYDETTHGRTSASWFQINADFTGSIGNRFFPFSCDYSGYFYIGGGQGTDDGFYKTNNFTSFTRLGTLPTELIGLAAAGCCAFNGKIYVAGGSIATSFGTTALYSGTLPGHLWEYDPIGNTWTKIVSGYSEFKRFWCELAANDKYMYFIQGHVRDTQAGQFPGGFVTGDQLGIMISEDKINWSYLNNPPPRNHTTSMVVMGNGDVHGICGSFYNGHYKIIR